MNYSSLLKGGSILPDWLLTAAVINCSQLPVGLKALKVTPLCLVTVSFTSSNTNARKQTDKTYSDRVRVWVEAVRFGCGRGSGRGCRAMLGHHLVQHVGGRVVLLDPLREQRKRKTW